MPFCICPVLLQVIYFDFAADGVTYASMWDGPGLPFAGSLIMISVDIVLYLFLAFYLDNVIPSMVAPNFPVFFATFINVIVKTINVAYHLTGA